MFFFLKLLWFFIVKPLVGTLALQSFVRPFESTFFLWRDFFLHSLWAYIYEWGILSLMVKVVCGQDVNMVGISSWTLSISSSSKDMLSSMVEIVLNFPSHLNMWDIEGFLKKKKNSRKVNKGSLYLFRTCYFPMYVCYKRKKTKGKI